MLEARPKRMIGLGVLFWCLLVSTDAAAQGATSGLNGANTAWIMTSTALVLFMTVPGLALFYGGLVGSRNVLSVLMQCFAICCLASLLWLICVYGLAFGDGGAMNSWIGGFDKAFLASVGVGDLTGDIPETVFFMFQMTFAIITPALIVGAYAERMKFAAVLWFSAIWLIVVYAPITHWVWGGGWLGALGVKDFAGGLVVHLSAGITALVLVAALGSRKGFPREIKPPHAPGMVMTGAAMLWVGWFGFNAGSALAADGNAGMALTVTHISAAAASLTWMAIEWFQHGKPSLVGIVTGTIAGLATITPGAGYVGPVGGLVFGILAGAICYWAVNLVKQRIRFDDSLDVFAVHGVGGALGTLLTAFFAAESLGGLGLGEGVTMGAQLWRQVVGIAATLVWAGVLSFVIARIVSVLVGLRVGDEEETEGLDITSHGERGYNL